MRTPNDALLGCAYQRAASTERVDKAQRLVHKAALECGPIAFASAALARVYCLQARQRQHPVKDSNIPLPSDFFSTPEPSQTMLEEYLSVRPKGREARLRLQEAAPSRLASDTMLMAFLRRAPASAVPAFLDWALALMTEAGDQPSCKSLLFLGADPNRPRPVENHFAHYAKAAVYSVEQSHPLTHVALYAHESYYEPHALRILALYLAMGADPNGRMNPLPPGVEVARSGVVVKKNKPLSPMAQCFSTGGPLFAQALFDAGATNPHQPDIQGVIPASLEFKGSFPQAKRALYAFASEAERLHLATLTERPSSPPTPSRSRPRI